MTRSEIAKVLIEVLTEFQEESGYPIVPITDRTRPIGELPGFDSLTGLEVTMELMDRLGCESPEGVNLLVHEAGTRALHVKEIAKRLYDLIYREAPANG